MKNNKKNIIQFLVWTRNGIAFCTSWFLILWLLYNRTLSIENISTNNLIEMILFVAGGVLIFSFIFTRVAIKKWSFLTRLNCFMILISIYQCVVFFCTGFWNEQGTLVEWFGFMGIILVCYLFCIAIYRIYSKKQGELYTQALQKYQHKRSTENG